MDEKRFVIYNERTVEDTLTGKRYVCSWKSDAEDIVKLLNELSYRLGLYEDDRWVQVEVCEELHKKISHLVDYIEKLVEEKYRLKDNCEKLQREKEYIYQLLNISKWRTNTYDNE